MIVVTDTFSNMNKNRLIITGLLVILSPTVKTDKKPCLSQ